MLSRKWKNETREIEKNWKNLCQKKHDFRLFLKWLPYPKTVILDEFYLKKKEWFWRGYHIQKRWFWTNFVKKHNFWIFLKGDFDPFEAALYHYFPLLNPLNFKLSWNSKWGQKGVSIHLRALFTIMFRFWILQSCILLGIWRGDKNS